MEQPDEKPVVLIVDDSAMNIRILADTLAPDYRVKVADNGPEALAVAKRTPHPDLILLDVMMPEMSGYEVFRHLKENPATRRIPVIFVTAKGSESDEEFGLNLGAVDYITKPFSLPVTRARVREHIANKKEADLLAELSLIDPLTQLANRRRLDERLANEWKRGQREQLPLSLLMIDIDHFKSYNDSYGHSAGDHCLQRVANALVEGVVRPGDLVARFGGEEFVVLLPGTTPEPAAAIAEKLRQRVFAMGLANGESTPENILTVSIGCATAWPYGNENSDSPTALIERADEMLYRSKAMGRNRVTVAADAGPAGTYQ